MGNKKALVIGKYDPEQTPETVYKLCLLSANNEEISAVLGITRETFNQWKNKYPDVSDALKRGREYADANVADRLYQRAMGYKHKETKVFCFQGEIITCDVDKHYPPDTGAAAIWLKNRHPDKWRDHPKNTEDGKRLKELTDLIKQSAKKAEKENEPDSDNSPPVLEPETGDGD